MLVSTKVMGLNLVRIRFFADRKVSAYLSASLPEHKVCLRFFRLPLSFKVFSIYSCCGGSN